MKAAEQFWYVLECVALAVDYFQKVSDKTALSEAGLADMTSAERFKRSFEDAALVEMTSAEQFWYILQCIAFGTGYFAKLPAKKALSEMRSVVVTVK